MNKENNQRRTWSIRKPLGIGICSLIFLFGVLGIWSVNASISGAVIAKGQIQVSSNKTALQHPIGGVVAELLVEDGDTVNAGDIVIRLDDTKLNSELNIIESELFDTLSINARLESVIDGQQELILHPLLKTALEKNSQNIVFLDRQKRQLGAYYESLDTNKRLLSEQIKQIESQVLGVEAELEAKKERIAFVDDELERNLKLRIDGLVIVTVIRTLEKEQITTKGEVGKLIAKVAELKGKILELDLKLHALTPALKEKAAEELNKLQKEAGILMEKRIRILDDLSKLEVRTPISGTIHDSKILGLLSVAVAAKPLMFVVPNDTPVIVVVDVDAEDIDQVFFEQEASLKFTAFSIRSMPIILGEVSKVSANTFLDEKTKKQVYHVEVSLTEEEIEKLGDKSLVAGMPVDVFLTTVSSSPLQYLLKPISEYFDRAFRDS